MARSAFSVSRSVALSLAALLVLSGAMFMVTTFQSDSEEWVLVEDQYLDDGGVYSGITSAYLVDDYVAEYTFVFDEDTSTYTVDVTGGTRYSSSTVSAVFLTCTDDFDFSKQYKISLVSSDASFELLRYITGTQNSTIFNLRSVAASDDGSYSADIILLDQLVTDLSFQDSMCLSLNDAAASTTYAANTLTFQVYELQTDNTGSVAAGITGLVLIVMGVFAMPMHNILRRR